MSNYVIVMDIGQVKYLYNIDYSLYSYTQLKMSNFKDIHA